MDKTRHLAHGLYPEAASCGYTRGHDHQVARAPGQAGFRKKKIGKYGGKQLPIAITILIGNSLAVVQKLTFIGRIKPDEQLGECGFSTPVAASDKQ